MNRYSYKDLQNVSLQEIYDKYANKNITILQFRQRVYLGTMTLHLALTQDPDERVTKNTIGTKYTTELYNKLCDKVDQHVTRTHFVRKLSKGLAPEIAIKKKRNFDLSVSKDSSNEEYLQALRKQEQREIRDQSKKKATPFSPKEKQYIEDVDILNCAFGKVS